MEDQNSCRGGFENCLNAQQTAASGLIFKEPFLWEKSRDGRCAMSIPMQDVEHSPLDPELVGDAPELPQLSELDVRGIAFNHVHNGYIEVSCFTQLNSSRRRGY